MDILEAIHARRTVGKFKPEAVPRDVLERIFGAGIWAPNHRLTEPWRFFVLGDGMKRFFGERYGILLTRNTDDEEKVKQVRTNVLTGFLSRPAAAVISCKQEGPDQKKREDYAATCCAIQNVLLAAWSEGVGVNWNTGPLINDPPCYEALGLHPEASFIAGIFTLGYPEVVPDQKRTPLGQVMRYVP
jgi:nitroreductase